MITEHLLLKARDKLMYPDREPIYFIVSDWAWENHKDKVIASGGWADHIMTQSGITVWSKN